MTMNKPYIRVLLVDDHSVVRAGFRRLLETTSDILVAGEAENGVQAVQACGELDPDVLVLDISMPEMGGLEAIESIQRRFPRIRILVLSVHENEPFPSMALEKGASGYLTKRCAPEELMKAVRELAAGRKYLASDIARRIALSNRKGERAQLESLTRREHEIFLLLARGDSTGEIAETVGISPKTVLVHRSRVMQKLGSRLQTDLMGLAIRLGLIDPYADNN
jgi:two-component system invasion response regulator UvrY